MLPFFTTIWTEGKCSVLLVYLFLGIACGVVLFVAERWIVEAEKKKDNSAKTGLRRYNKQQLTMTKLLLAQALSLLVLSLHSPRTVLPVSSFFRVIRRKRYLPALPIRCVLLYVPTLFVSAKPHLLSPLFFQLSLYHPAPSLLTSSQWILVQLLARLLLMSCCMVVVCREWPKGGFSHCTRKKFTRFGNSAQQRHGREREREREGLREKEWGSDGFCPSAVMRYNDTTDGRGGGVRMNVCSTEDAKRLKFIRD